MYRTAKCNEEEKSTTRGSGKSVFNSWLNIILKGLHQRTIPSKCLNWPSNFKGEDFKTFSLKVLC